MANASLCKDFPNNFTSNSIDDDFFNSIDFNSITFGQKPVPKPTWEIALKSVIFFIVLIVGLVGNYLIIHVIIKFRESRNITNLFICNMAIADLLSVVLCAWAAVVNDISTPYYVLGSFYCKFESYTKVTCLLSSAISLVLISLYRLLLVWNSSTPLSKSIHAKAYLIMACVWIVSNLISVPLLVKKKLKERIWCDYVEIWCSEDDMLRSYWVALLSFMVYIPVVIMIIIYTVILIKIKSFEERVKNNTNAAILEHRRKIIKMLFLYLINAVICWLPLQIIVFYRFIHMNKIPKWMRSGFFVGHLFAAVNSAINPIIYGIVNKSFRSYIFKIHPKLFAILGKPPVASSNRITPIARTPLCALYMNSQQPYERRRNKPKINTISFQLSRRDELLSENGAM